MKLLEVILGGEGPSGNNFFYGSQFFATYIVQWKGQIFMTRYKLVKYFRCQNLEKIRSKEICWNLESENNYRIPTPWPGVSQDVSKQNVIFQKINSQMVNATLHPLDQNGFQKIPYPTLPYFTLLFLLSLPKLKSQPRIKLIFWHWFV